jgi:diguanylate cyclase (GGDEF)-like protein
VNRTIVIALAGIAVCASYLVVILGIAPERSSGPLAFASVAIPGIVTGVVMASYVIWETRNARGARDQSSELSAQLVRKELEIGRLSTVDEMTGLYSRRAFDDLLRIEVDRFKRHKRPASLLLVAIDDHSASGEPVGRLNKGLLLAELSSIAKDVLRTTDLGCRYTNESLGYLLAETDAAQADLVAGKLRAAVEAHEFAADDGRVGGFSVGQGIAVLSSAVSSAVELTRAAERALADARSEGGGKVQIVELPESESEAA